jgi:hypothetical protein
MKILSLTNTLVYIDGFEKGKIWKIDGLTDEECLKILSINLFTPKTDKSPSNLPMAIMDKITQRPCTAKELKEMMLLKDISVDEDDSWTTDIFLEKKGIFMPETKTSEAIRAIFRRILFFINAHENYNFMRNSFSWALSDEEDSLEWFELFISMGIVPISKKRLLKEINTLKPTYEDPNVTNANEIRKKLDKQGRVE